MKELNKIRKKIDYSILSQKERVKLTHELLDDNEFIMNYFNVRKTKQDLLPEEDMPIYNESEKLPKFNPHPVCGDLKSKPSYKDRLSHDDPVCKFLESVANYIIYTPGAERIDKKTQYNFYTTGNLQRKINREQSYDAITDKNNEDKYDSEKLSTGDVIDFLVDKSINYKKKIEYKVEPEDLEKYPVLQEYQDSINNIKYRLDSNIDMRKSYLRSHMGRLKDDQRLYKKILEGTFQAKDPLPDTMEIDYDQFDFFDKEHVLALLKFAPKKLNTDLGILIYDLDQLLNNIYLSPTEKKILDLYRAEDSVTIDIAKELKRSHQFVLSSLNRICDKVVNKYEEVYEDWYYLNKVKGKYKTCSCCGIPKLANERYFSPDKRNKDGLQGICKKCDSNRKKQESFQEKPLQKVNFAYTYSRG